jgi:actin-related protein
MDMHPDFVNFYIEKLLREIESLTKTRLLLSTQVEYSEKIILGLTEKLEKAERANVRKAAKKEVDTSETF